MDGNLLQNIVIKRFCSIFELQGVFQDTKVVWRVSVCFCVCIGLHRVVMIASIHILQEIFAIDMLTVLKPFLEHDRKHVLRLSRLF